MPWFRKRALFASVAVNEYSTNISLDIVERAQHSRKKLSTLLNLLCFRSRMFWILKYHCPTTQVQVCFKPQLAKADDDPFPRGGDA
jgi:hypothetical protein